jgi:hypothetical protein
MIRAPWSTAKAISEASSTLVKELVRAEGAVVTCAICRAGTRRTTLAR